MDLHLFAGPGGIEQGIRDAGLSSPCSVGIEWEKYACLTAKTAGHERIRGDVAALDPQPFGAVRLLTAGPPCPPWSAGGKHLGELDRAACHALADRMADGDDSTGFHDWADPRSALVCQPIRWIRDLRPKTVILENVPGAASFWVHFTRILGGWGYSCWTGDLLATDFGAATERKRRILIASRIVRVTQPVATHAKMASGGHLFGAASPWVTMAGALGWGMTKRPYFSLTAGTKSGGPDGDFLGGSGARKSYRAIQADPSAWRPEPTGRMRISIAEAGALMGFPADYPWQGGRTRQCEQIANAVPPPMAAACARAAFGYREAEVAA